MEIKEIAETRYTSKAFDPQRKLSEKTINDLKEVLRLTPSSCNLQPWHFFFVSHQENKDKIAQSMEGISSENQSRVRDASLVVIFCSQRKIDETYLTQLLDQEEADGRFRNHEARLSQEKLRQYYVGKLSKDSAQNWFKHQIYIALGAFLIEAKAMGLDACPMEGFDPKKLDQIFNLKEKGLSSTVLVSLGHHSDKDFNKDLPKSRLSPNRLFTDL